MENKTKLELRSIVLDALKDGRLNDKYGCDVHHEIFNTNYFIIGYYAAEQWLINNVGIFSAIETIKEYEQINFGEVNTDFSSSEKVCNMYVYILGEEVLNESKVLNRVWDKRLTEKDIKELIKEFTD